MKKYVDFVQREEKFCVTWKSGNIDFSNSAMSLERDFGKPYSA